MTEELRQRLEEVRKAEKRLEDAERRGESAVADFEAKRRAHRIVDAFPLLVSEVERLEAENERLKIRIAEVEAGDDWKELVRPVHRCGFVHPDDGTCFHPDAMTPECHLGVVCPVVESTKARGGLTP